MDVRVIKIYKQTNRFKMRFYGDGTGMRLMGEKHLVDQLKMQPRYSLQ